MNLLSRWALPLAILFLAMGCARIVSTYNVFSTTGDEPAHVACGLEYVANHVYKLETQHPPLTRAMIALLPYLNGARPRGHKSFQNEGWDIITYQQHPEKTVFLMRLGNLPFFVLGGVVAFLWGRRYFGGAIGVIATFLYTLLTPILAHAGLATTDMGLAACLGAAFLSAVVWAERPTTRNAVVFGICSGLVAVAKFTALGYYPLGLGFALLFYILATRPGMAGLTKLAEERAKSFGIAVGLGLLVVWATFFFSFGRVPHWNSTVSVPAPEFFDGIEVVLRHNATGHPAYLLGTPGTTGWWYYFPVAIGVKTPLAFLLLLMVGVVFCWQRRAFAQYLLPVAYCLGILIPAMMGRINIGVRHVLPIYLGFSVIAAIGLVQLARWRPWATGVAGVLVLWLAVTGIVHHPDYIPYFNELVRDPESVLLDSDYDWGQDLKRAAIRLRQLGATQVNYGYVGSYEQPFLQAYPGLPPIQPINPTVPVDGWTLVSPTMHRSTQYGLEYRYPNLSPWFEYIGPPRERIGTLQLYYLPPGTVNKQK